MGLMITLAMSLQYVLQTSLLDSPSQCQPALYTQKQPQYLAMFLKNTSQQLINNRIKKLPDVKFDNIVALPHHLCFTTAMAL
jgi:hypothetical protein